MSFAPLAISTFAIVLIVLAAVFAVLLVFGFLGARARDRRQAGSWEQAVRSADAALAQAAASATAAGTARRWRPPRARR